MTVTVRAAGEAAERHAGAGRAGRPGTGGTCECIQRSGESSIRSASTDSLGLVTFADLLPGRYRVTSLRLLEWDETLSRCRDTCTLGQVINALGGGGIATVQTPCCNRGSGGRGGPARLSRDQRNPRLVAQSWTSGRRFNTRRAQYVEVYNNADTTVYLDGKILASAFWYVWESSLDETSLDNCEEFRRWRLDPEGIWSEGHLRFPGSGREYALTPGQARVVAMQAIDHREVAPELGFPDLSQAGLRSGGHGSGCRQSGRAEHGACRTSTLGRRAGKGVPEPGTGHHDRRQCRCGVPAGRRASTLPSGLPPVSRRSAPRSRRSSTSILRRQTGIGAFAIGW